MRLGVIDLGTNTFHLLIVEIKEGKPLKELFRRRIFVQLAEDGINKIGPAPFSRGLNAMAYYSEILLDFNVKNVKAFGTAALRRASNGEAFIEKVLKKTDIQIELISGDREAHLICEGVRLAVPMTGDPMLIMDIGGGSVEFIIANDKTVFWAQSFKIGVAVLFNDFHKTDPISTLEVNTLLEHLEQTLQPLLEVLKKHSVRHLVGASGTFDVLAEMLVKEKKKAHYASIPIAEFHPVYQRLVASTLKQRYRMSEIPDSRAELIIVAMVLLKFIIMKTDLESILVSDYAMKEGILSEMMALTPPA